MMTFYRLPSQIADLPTCKHPFQGLTAFKSAGAPSYRLSLQRAQGTLRINLV